jgi:N-methylhydantoinase A/oxoprolinase/acetone carboxylase beta subunit
MSLRIGIDVGGTNTDAAVLKGTEVIAATKVITSDDVTTGILTALTEVLEGLEPSDVDSVFIGTTHFINAIAQAKNLDKVAAVRLATPPQTLLPMIDWPEKLLAAVNGGVYICAGGSQYDGRPLNPVDEDALRAAAREIKASGVRRIALSAVFSVVNDEPEKLAERILQEELPEATITRSTLVGRTGILERENATILNAALLTLADRVVEALEDVIARVGITAPILLSQNDGTVMTLETARLFPIFTIASGPTNSMRGAALLTGIRDGVVVDVGGTTTDVGMLRHGFPREATVAMSLAGVRSNFSIPDVLSLALGGGTIIGDDGESVGPESVGHRIVREARVFGGETLTFTDVAVAGGAEPIGNASAVSGLDQAVVDRALAIAGDRVLQAVDKAKLTGADTPIIVVGGGASLLAPVPGLDHAVIPANAGVANAVGAAFAEAGGEVDRVFALEGTTRAEILKEAREAATARAIEAGADPEQVRIITSEDIPLTHLPSGAAVHVRVKAVGPFLSPVLVAEGE